MQNILANLHSIEGLIQGACHRAGRNRSELTLLAVSKTQAASSILQAYQAGQMDFGENYVQEWEKKADEISTCPGLRWHFIGHLQSNKVKEVVGRVDTIQTVDSLKLAQKIEQRAAALGLQQKVFLEILLENEANKSGWATADLLASLQTLAALPHLQCEGLMAIPPPNDDAEKSRPYFKGLKSTLDEINASGVFSHRLRGLSMGMSHDFEVAIEEGATMIRIGTAIFGPRL